MKPLPLQSTVALLLIVSTARTQPSVSGNEDDSAELADVRAYLTQLTGAFADSVTVFDDASFGFVTVAIDADWRGVALPTDAPERQRAFTYVRLGQRRALLSYGPDDKADHTDCSQAVRVSCWTGAEWYEAERRGDVRTHTFSPVPRPQSAVDFVAVFNSSDNWPSFLGTHDLAAFVQPSLLKDRVAAEGDLRLTFWTSETARTATVQLALSTDPTLRLEVVTVSFGRIAPGETTPTPFGRKMLRFDAWESFGDSLIPKTATYLDGRIDDEDGDGSTAVSARRLTRRSIRRIEPGDGSEACVAPIPVADGDHVLDTCYGLRYKIGDPVLFADHLRIELDDPIESRITNELSELVGEIEKVGEGRFRKKDG